jgi:hypothetical protein
VHWVLNEALGAIRRRTWETLPSIVPITAGQSIFSRARPASPAMRGISKLVRGSTTATRPFASSSTPSYRGTLRSADADQRFIAGFTLAAGGIGQILHQVLRRAVLGPRAIVSVVAGPGLPSCRSPALALSGQRLAYGRAILRPRRRASRSTASARVSRAWRNPPVRSMSRWAACFAYFLWLAIGRLHFQAEASCRWK